ncbi:MAG TPA: PKD domain-containing protein [Solirubrobacteraceae bacterium]|nr:PKD domain-containing protein [Solirubrobacteraceae bacterium]
MTAPLRTRPARSVLIALVLSIATALGPAVASAAGPGVTVYSAEKRVPSTISGAQIGSGLSITSLLGRAGVNLATVRYITVESEDGSLVLLRRSQFGGAVVSDSGDNTRFSSASKSVVNSAGAGPLQITVNGGSLLAVSATASRDSADVGEPITFSARVRSPPPGPAPTFTWTFGDGTTASGQSVTHSFNAANEIQVQVFAQVIGGSSRCQSVCGGVANVSLRIGDPEAGQDAPGATSPGSGTGNPQAAGSGTGTGAGGAGGSGGGTTPGATGESSVQAVVDELARQRAADRAKERAAARRKREAAERAAAADRARRRVSPAEVTRPSGLVVTGVLLTGQGLTVTKLPTAVTEKPAGTPAGVQAARGTSDDAGVPVPAAVGLALLVLSIGALREQRGVRLRIA